jgi:hypothetical protein
VRRWAREIESTGRVIEVGAHLSEYFGIGLPSAYVSGNFVAMGFAYQFELLLDSHLAHGSLPDFEQSERGVASFEKGKWIAHRNNSR